MARTGGDTKFITVAHDEPERFVNGENVLIKRVHEEHWDVFYDFKKSCPASRRTQENYQILRENLEEGIRTWLAPLKEITNRPIVDKFNFYRDERKENVDHEIHVTFICEDGRSSAGRGSRSIHIKTSPIETMTSLFAPSLPYRISTLLHELGHVFDLADTYVGNPSFSPPSTGGNYQTIGRQPQSVMSIGAGCWVKGQRDICLDDKRAIQWLYRYHWEELDPTDCPDEFEYEQLSHKGRTIGGCVFKHPLIIQLRQKHLMNASQILFDDKNLKINNKDKHGLAALHYAAPLYRDFNIGEVRRFLKNLLRYPNINVNITDNHGNSPLHWAAWFGHKSMTWRLLFLEEVNDSFPERKKLKINAQNKYGMTALHNAAKGGKNKCTDYLLMRSDIEVNIKDSRFGNTPLHEAAKNGHTEVVKMLLAHKDINRNIRNRAGKTARQLAEARGYEETVRAFD